MADSNHFVTANTKAINKTMADINKAINKTAKQNQATVAMTHEAINMVVAERLALIREGAGYAVHSIVDPAVKGGNFVLIIGQGIKIAVVTFESFMFDSSTRRRLRM